MQTWQYGTEFNIIMGIFIYAMDINADLKPFQWIKNYYIDLQKEKK